MAGGKKRAIYIDCDPGLDDAVALALAASAPEFDIAAITTTCGNAALERVTDNALAVSANLGLKVPVYAGADRPLRCKPHFATDIWGGDGSLGLKRQRRAVQPESAPDVLLRLLQEANDNSVLICCLGPLTNLALVLGRDRQLSAKIDRLMIMGGALGKGNATAVAEFNIWFDPHAAKRVFDADIHTVAVPFDLTRTVMMKRAHIDRLAKSDKLHARLAADMLAMAGSPGHPATIHDAVVIGCLLWPDLFSFERGRVSVVIEDGPARGQTRFAKGEGRHIILTDVQHDKLLDAMVAKLIGKAKGGK
jgi:purine nucleosidase